MEKKILNLFLGYPRDSVMNGSINVISWCSSHGTGGMIKFHVDSPTAKTEGCLKKRKWNDIDNLLSREILKIYEIIRHSNPILRCPLPELNFKASSAVGKMRKKSRLAFRPAHTERSSELLGWMESENVT